MLRRRTKYEREVMLIHSPRSNMSAHIKDRRERRRGISTNRASVSKVSGVVRRSQTFQSEAEEIRAGIYGQAAFASLSSSLLFHLGLQHLTEFRGHLVEQREEASHRLTHHHLLVEQEAVGTPLLTVPVERGFHSGQDKSYLGWVQMFFLSNCNFRCV